MSKKMNKLQLSLFEDAVAVIEMPPAFIAQKTPLAQEIEVALEPKSVRDLFVLRDEYLNGVAGDRSKIEANLAAIEIVKGATATGRKLTSDEKSRVAAYSGWGGLSDVFAQNTKYPAQQARLQELLGPQAYASAMESVLSAYYTEPAVIRSIWEMVRHMGFEGGRVLEPSCGVGHFIGAMPQEMRQQSKVVMVEIDEITAAMAGGLYADDQTMVYPTGLQSAPIRPESFDLVVGNVPFGNYRVHDKRFDHLRANIHDYFFAKCLDALRPGGVMCLITSTWTMDKSESRMRKYLSERANLLTAIRLALAADAVKAGRRKIDLFKVGNAMLVYEDYGHKQLRVRIGGEMAYEVRLPYGAENIASALRSGVIECQLREQLDREIKRVAELEVSIRAMQERMKKPFEHERALEEALERQAEIDSHLEVDAQDKSLVSFEESSD